MLNSLDPRKRLILFMYNCADTIFVRTIIGEIWSTLGEALIIDGDEVDRSVGTEFETTYELLILLVQ